MRRLDGITDSMDMVTVKDRKAWRATVHGSQRVGHDLAAEQQQGGDRGHQVCRWGQNLMGAKSEGWRKPSRWHDGVLLPGKLVCFCREKPRTIEMANITAALTPPTIAHFQHPFLLAMMTLWGEYPLKGSVS